MSNPKKNIILLHVPKAGGTTLRQIFLEQYDGSTSRDEIYIINRTREAKYFKDIDPKMRAKYRLLLGHLPFGIHEYLSGEYQYVSMVRNPIDRAVSDYAYSKSFKKHEAYSMIHDQKMNLVEYVSNYASSWHSNGQTKLFAGAQYLHEECTTETFNRAIENIERYFLFVGILEKFDLSLTLLKNRLSWSQPYYKKKNKTLIRYKVSDKEKAIISELNQYDLKLCAYCEEKFLGVGNKERLATKMFSTLNGIRNALRH